MRAPAMKRQETREIHGSKMKLVLRRITRAANFVGWKFVVTCDNHLVTRGFTNTLELDRAFDRAEEKAIAAIESNQQDIRFEVIYDKWSKMPEHGRHAVACYMLGLMSNSMTDFHLDKFSEQVDEFNEIHEEMKKADLDRQHEVNDRDIHALAAAEESNITKDIPTEDLPDADFKGKTAVEVFDDSKFENNEADEEVDASDCCKREDPKCVQPPLRSSVQSSPDDPYYVCGYCGDKCELITIKRSELED